MIAAAAKRATLVSLALFACVGAGSGSARSDAARAGSAVVSITFDDSYRTQVMNALPILQRYGLVATAYVITGTVGDSSDDPIWTPMTWADIRALRDAGWEIGAHTVTHPDLTTLDDKQLNKELVYSSKHIERELGQAPVSFATPFGASNDRVRAAIQKVYQNSVSAEDFDSRSGGLNQPGKIDPYNISREVVVRDTLPDEVCDAVDGAVEKKAWLVLAFHQIVDMPRMTPDGDYMVTKGDLEAIAKCISDDVKAGKLSVMNITAAVSSLSPMTALAKPDRRPAHSN